MFLFLLPLHRLGSHASCLSHPPSLSLSLLHPVLAIAHVAAWQLGCTWLISHCSGSSLLVLRPRISSSQTSPRPCCSLAARLHLADFPFAPSYIEFPSEPSPMLQSGSSVASGRFPIYVGTDCSGLGAALVALQHLGINFRHIFASEVDAYARVQLQRTFPPMFFSRT